LIKSKALDTNGNITESGNLMADFPISPYLAKILLSSITYKCSEEMIIIVSMLSVEDVFISPRGQKKQEEAHKSHSYFHHISGDHMTMLNIYKQWESKFYGNYSKEWCKKYFLHYRALVMAKNIKNQLELIFQRLNLPILSCRYNNSNVNDDFNERNHKRKHKHYNRHSSTEDKDDDEIYDITMKNYDYTLILKAVCQAYYMNVAKRITNRPFFYNYKQSTSDTLLKIFNKDQNKELVPLFIHPSSSIHLSSHSQDSHYLEWVIYHHTIFTNRCYLRHVSVIHFEWVKDLLENVDKIDYSKLFEKDIHDINSIEKETETNSNYSDIEERSTVEEEENIKYKKRKLNSDIEKIDVDKIKKSNHDHKITNEKNDENDIEKQKQKLESVTNSRKAALERYLQRKHLKEKRKK